MGAGRRLVALGATLALLAPAAGARPAAARAGREADPRALLRSRELWATVNVCSPGDRPNTVGIRGSMPGDGRARDRMYMSFRLQYQNAATKGWADLLEATSRSWVPVGAAAGARQGGFTFTLKPMTGKPAVVLRGVVDFQWRRGRTVRASATRVTTAGHRSVAGADPRGYSAATCTVG
jgi:hypothetical protein